MLERLPEHNPGVLHHVVIIDVDVAGCFDLQIKQAVLGKERQHVIEERDTSVDYGHTSAIDIQLYFDLRLFSRAGDFCYA